MKASAQEKEIKLYMQRANETIKVAAHNLQGDFYTASVNRSYFDNVRLEF